MPLLSRRLALKLLGLLGFTTLGRFLLSKFFDQKAPSENIEKINFISDSRSSQSSQPNIATQKNIVFYVASNGNDSWTGKQPDPNSSQTDGPFKTIQKARDIIRTLKQKQGGLLKQPVTIFLRGGRYLLNEPLIFNPDDSGSENCSITYSAYQNEIPIISGGQKISGWSTTNINRHRVWVASLPKIFSGSQKTFRNLWVNEKRRYVARYPKNSYLKVYANAPEWDATQWKQSINRFYVNPTDLEVWKDLTNARAVVGVKWMDQHLPIKDIDFSTGLLTTKIGSAARIDKGYPLYLENSLDFLTSPGEWFLDEGKGLLYYYPQKGETLETVEIIAPFLSQLLLLQGDKQGKYPNDITFEFVKHIRFQGLTFAHTNWDLPEGWPSYQQAAIQTGQDINTPPYTPDGHRCSGVIFGDGVKDVIWENCTVAHVGSWAIDLRTGCQNNVVKNCKLYDLGAGGIRIGYDVSSTPAGTNKPNNYKIYTYTNNFNTNNNSVLSCEIYDYGRIFHGAVGIWTGQAFDNLISQNNIYNSYYSGINIGWGAESKNYGNRVLNNYVHDIAIGLYSPFLNDLAGIYTFGKQKLGNIIIKNNIIHNVQSYHNGELKNGPGAYGIYLDEHSSQVIVEKNIVYKTLSGGLMLHFKSGVGNIIRNNIFALGVLRQIWCSGIEPASYFVFERNIIFWTEGKLLEGKLNSFNFLFDYNLYGTVNEKALSFQNLSWQEWQAKGMDKHSIIADPLFINPEKGDFRLKPKSPAWGLGFESLS